MWRELPPTAGMQLQVSDFLTDTDSGQLARQLAVRLGVQSVQIECSGSACFVIALEYLKTLSERTKVIIAGYTCPLMAIAVAQAGLQPVVCDTYQDSFELDAQCLEAKVDNDTLAIVPTHLGGLPAQVQGVLECARRNGVYVIEDTAQCLGAMKAGIPIGLDGDIGIYSLTSGKGLTIYQGGFLATKDDAIREGLQRTAKKLVKQDVLMEARRTLELLGYGGFYNPLGLALTYGIKLRYWLKRDKPELAVGDVFDLAIELTQVGRYRLKVGGASAARYAAFLAANVERGRRRAKRLAKVSGVKVFQERESECGSWPFLSVVFERPEACARALRSLWGSGVGVTKLFAQALTGFPYLAQILGEQAPAPNAERLAACSLTITNSCLLSDEAFEFIVKVIECAAGEYSS